MGSYHIGPPQKSDASVTFLLFPEKSGASFLITRAQFLTSLRGRQALRAKLYRFRREHLIGTEGT